MMHKILITITITLLFIVSAYSQDVNGDITTVDDKTILKVWGTHYERGYAHGYLLADRVKAEFDQFMVGSVFGSAVNYESARQYFVENFAFETKYEDECNGIIDGITDAGISLYNPVLGRDYDDIDAMVFTAFTDLISSGLFGDQPGFGCSTLSNWGGSTLGDLRLNGSLVVTRALDGHMDQMIDDNHTMIIHYPSEEDELKWLNIGFPGMVSCFSAVNEAGVAAFQNIGNHIVIPNLNTFHPMMLSIRNGIEMTDFNGDLLQDHSDVFSSIAGENSMDSWIITAVSENEGIIIESNNQNGTQVRDTTDNYLSPAISGQNIAATNHFRVLYMPYYCPRYQGMADSLDSNSAVTIERNWSIMSGAPAMSINTHFIQYIPSLGILNWSSAPNSYTPAYTQEPTVFNVDSLFQLQVSVDEDHSNTPGKYDLLCYPNPFNNRSVVSFTLEKAGNVSLKVFDVTGREVRELQATPLQAGYHEVVWNAEDMASGVYFVRLELQSAGFLQHSETRKLLLVK